MFFLKKLFVGFFVIPKEDVRFKHHLVSTFLLLLLVFLPDVILSVAGKCYINIHLVITAIAVLTCFLLSFSGIVIKILLGLFIFIAQFTQLNYAFVTGFAIEPLLIAKIFQDNTDDLLDNLSAVWHVDLIYFICFVLFLVFNIRKRKFFYFSPFSFIAIFTGCFWLFYNGYNKKMDKFFVSPTRQTIRNSLSSYAFFLTNIKSISKFDTKIVDKAYKKYEVKKITDKTPRVIIIFMGESTNAKDMSLINQDLRDTTPLLKKFAEGNEDHFAYTTAMSGAVGTMASHALFFNMIREPGNVNSIKRIEHNLFKMAKENGYKTHWLSTQSIINPDYSAVFADDIQTQESNAVQYKMKGDDHLIDEFKKMDLSKGKHLVVINPKTAHIPFYKNYIHHKKEFKKFADNKTRIAQEMSAYHNSILYLDWLLNELLSVAIRKDADYFIITSDHGEFIGENGGFHGFSMGHNILDMGIVFVPYIVYSKESNKTLMDSIRNTKLTSHYEISKFVAGLLGYEVKNPNDDGKTLFIHEARINGNYKVLPYRIENGEAIKSDPTTAETYMNEIVSKLPPEKKLEDEKKSNTENNKKGAIKKQERSKKVKTSAKIKAKDKN